MSVPSVISFFFVAFMALAIEHFTRNKGASPPDAAVPWCKHQEYGRCYVQRTCDINADVYEMIKAVAVILAIFLAASASAF